MQISESSREVLFNSSDFYHGAYLQFTQPSDVFMCLQHLTIPWIAFLCYHAIRLVWCLQLAVNAMLMHDILTVGRLWTSWSRIIKDKASNCVSVICSAEEKHLGDSLVSYHFSDIKHLRVLPLETVHFAFNFGWAIVKLWRQCPGRPQILSCKLEQWEVNLGFSSCHTQGPHLRWASKTVMFSVPSDLCCA